jgi:hypothetical protein
MYTVPDRRTPRERGFALVIVLAFVVLLSGLVVAYLSLTTSDRPVAQSSVHQTKVDQLAASGMDLVIGGLRQEIVGPSPTPTPPHTYVPTYVPPTNAGMLPVTFGNPDPTNIPNLVRRSIRADAIPAPGVSSLASAVNATDDVSANGRSISKARWNKHYLIPQANIGIFTAPDWVILTRNGPVAFTGWNDLLKDPTPTNDSYAVGRFAYSIYDEGQLLDANVVGYPTDASAAPIPAQRVGRKGPVAFVDLTTLPNQIPQSQTDKIVGWRNYGSIQATAAFGTFPSFNFTAAFATNYFNNFLLFNTSGFSRTNGLAASNQRTDQMFLSRQQLIAFQQATGFSADALQYLTTFSRELNAPSWKPSTPVGSTIDYETLANTPTASTSTAINRDLLNVYVPGTDPTAAAFTRADGTTAFQTDLLIERRFPLSRINGLGPTGIVTTANSTIINGVSAVATAATIQRDFGLQWDGSGNPPNNRWKYVGPTGSTVLSTINRLDQVAAEIPGREPNFFELLKAGILSGSVGVGSAGANTFVAADAKYLSSDYQIMQIGANIINQWNSGNVPIFFIFGTNEFTGIKNLPYLNKLVFKPAWTTIPPKGPTPTTYQFDAWLLPSLWNPHQQDPLNPPPASQNIQIAMTSPGTFSASTASPAVTTSSITGSATQFMTVAASTFGTSPSAPTAIVTPPNPPSTITRSPDVTIPVGGYYGFHVVATPITTAPTGLTTAQPNFATPATFELQVQVGTAWKTYQKWTGCTNSTPLVCAPAGWLTVTNLQDPEFVTLDPRTLRFGVWGNAANQPGASPSDYTNGVAFTMEVSAGTYEAITALPPQPQGTNFIFSGPPYALYNYANNPTSSTVYYTDLDTLRRQGDSISGATTAMLPAATADRPLILNRPFQSMAELGQVFRDEPWKTLDFFMTTASPDAGLVDIFSLHEASMEAGKTSLNTKQKPVLTAILSGAIKRLAGTGADVITTAQRDAIVNALYNITSTQPMIHKTDLLTQLAADPSVIALGRKEARDLVIRAFSDATQTRTWNLMIDVVAQSGRYPPNAGSGPNTANPLANFMVEGEQHYWVHVAIDRFTGQVIDKQIEVVNE